MNPYTHDMNHALANEKIDRYRAEADTHRLARPARTWGVNSLQPKPLVTE